MNTILPGLLAAMLVGQIGPKTPLTGAEWPAYRGNAGLSGVADEDSIKPPFKLSWTYRLDGDASGDAGGGVIVADGKVFVSIHNTRSILALDARTGRLLWERAGIAGGIRTVPTFAAGRLHVLIRANGVDQPKKASLLVLDAATGKDIWEQPLEAKGIDPHRAGLPVIGGLVFCSEGGDTATVSAFAAATGKKVWHTNLGNEFGACPVTPVAANGKVYVGTRATHGWKAAQVGSVVALDAASGKLLWRREGIYPWTSLSTDGTVVACAAFQSKDDKFTLLDAATGETLWQAPKRFHYTPGTIAKDLVLIKPYGSEFVAVDRLTGKERWKFRVNCSSGCCSPVIAGKYVYLGTGIPPGGDLEGLHPFSYGKSVPSEQGVSGAVHAIDMTTGKSVWNFSTGNTICGEPALAYGRLFFHSRDGNVYCFEPAKEGEPTTPETIDKTPAASPEVVADLLKPALFDKPHPAKDWPMLGGSPDRAGREGISLRLPLELAWKLDTGDRIVGAAAIRDARVFVGSDSGKIHAVDLRSGKSIWHFDTGAAVRCSPTVAGGLVYAGSDSGAFHALEADTGKKRWTFMAGGPVRGSPVLAGGLVVFGANDHHLYALDRATGKKVWSFRMGGYCVQPPPVIHGDRVYCAQWNELVYALDLKTGKEVWRSFVPISVEALAYHRDRLWVRNLHYLVELDPATGRRLRLGDASWGWGGMAFHKNKLFVSGIQSQYGTHGGTVSDLDQEGKDIQKVPTLENVQRIRSKGLANYPKLAAMGTPLALGDFVCFAAVSGNLYVTDPTGKVAWTFTLGGTCHASPVAADGVLVVGCDDGHLYAFREK